MSARKEVDAYIKPFPEEVQSILKKIHRIVLESAPGAEEAISYGIPTVRLGGKNLVHFAGFKGHIGFYPSPGGIEKFAKELSKYKTSKGAVQFPIDQPVPYPLIARMVKFRIKELNKSNSHTMTSGPALRKTIAECCQSDAAPR